VIGAADKRNFAVLRELSEQYQMLLFDKDPKALSDIYDSLWQTITILISKKCLALLASWEADIIILSGFALTKRLFER
jgi:hypothetical protein